MSEALEMVRTTPDDGWMICPCCDGYGEISEAPCPECGGDGLFNMEDDYT